MSQLAPINATVVVSSIRFEKPAHCGSDRAAALNVLYSHVSLRRNEWCPFHGDFADINATAVSSIRFEKPHSLSYQLDTFTKLPETLVNVESKVEEWPSWLKSTDTSGAVL